MLAALILAFDFQPCREMHDSYGAFGFVDVLPARASGPHGFFADVFVPIDLDFLVVIDFRRNIDGRKTRLPLALSVEGADTDEAVNACLAFEVAVSHRP